jgi:hypothetical protein
MSVTSRASATSLVIVIGLMLSVSGVAAQPYSGELEIATGEIWPSMEPHIQTPRMELPEPGQAADLEIAAGDVWPSRQNTPTSQALVPAIVVDQPHGQMAR